jgi:hypothetical protein
MKIAAASTELSAVNIHGGSVVTDVGDAASQGQSFACSRRPTGQDEAVRAICVRAIRGPLPPKAPANRRNLDLRAPCRYVTAAARDLHHAARSHKAWSNLIQDIDFYDLTR